MANMQTECLNRKCSGKVSGGVLWCCMLCKKQFLLHNYSDGQTMIWFKEANKSFRETQKKVMEEIKESGLSASEFLRSLGDFEDDAPQEKCN